MRVLTAEARGGRPVLRALLALLLCVTGTAAARAQGPADGSNLRVHLITIGQGPAIWERFGHNAIVIEDTVTRQATSYDYGRFDFGDPAFVPRFVMGRMHYWMASADANRLLAYYRGTGRQIVAQRLDLDPAERAALRDALVANDTDSTRYYAYDYYLDNCSTRVRDALDRALGGVVKDSLEGRWTGTTFRWHTLRVTANNPATWAGLDLVLGPGTDHEIDAWAESFLPQRFAGHLAGVTRPGPGGPRPIVAATDTLDEGGRWPEPAAPPRWWPWFLTAGVLLGGLLRDLGRHPVGFTIVAGFFAVVTGLAGLVLILMWAFTDHTVTYGNVNLLIVPVTGLVLAGLLPRAVREGRQGGAGRGAWVLAWVAVAGCVAAAVLALAGITAQRSWVLLALVGPAWVGMALGMGRARGGRLDAA
ncbi:MAG TPA: DUF4105 domain-containing protein [Gemmatimonadales bacterium]|nr:DUF4105 domain-containing protein [Gemmatimonadales bacterium]